MRSTSAATAECTRLSANVNEHQYGEDYQQRFDDDSFSNAETVELRPKFDAFWPSYRLCAPGGKLQDFVQSFVIFPRLSIVAANRSLLHVANDLVLLGSTGKTERPFEFYYVSAGPIGAGYYLSTLLFRQCLFESKPIIPVAYLIHERRNVDDHRTLFEMIHEKCPDIATTDCVFITDREFGDIKSILPTVLQLYSWHYFEDDIISWIETNGGISDENRYLSDDVFALMKLKTCEQFNHELAAKRRQWPAEFSAFFDAYLKADIVAKGGRWHAEHLRNGVYDPYCGVVIPSCGDLNQLVSDLVEWQDITLDQLLICISHFSEYYARENEKSMHQVGAFKMQSRYANYARPVRRLRSFPAAEIADPRDIVNFVRMSSIASR